MANINKLWYSGQPDGQDYQNCSTYHAETGELADDGCSVEACFACSWINEPLFHLRGLCKNSGIAIQYVLLPDRTFDGMFFFLGLGPTNILFKKETESWLIVADKLVDLITPNGTANPEEVLGKFKPDNISNKMPIGKKTWNLTNGECEGQRDLKLTGVSAQRVL